MSHGKSQFATWYCKEEIEKDGVKGVCNKAHSTVTDYDKRRDAEITKELSMFCPKCRKHTTHKRKDTKKGNA